MTCKEVCGCFNIAKTIFNMDLFTIVTARADYEQGALVIIDQTQLPGREVYLVLKTPEEIWEAIYLLKVRGAPAIGVAADYGVAVCMQKGEGLFGVFSPHGGEFVYGIGAYGSCVVEASRCGSGNFETSLARRGRGNSG